MSLPAFFEPLLREQYGPDLTALIIEGCRARRTTLRSNALKSSPEAVAACLEEVGIAYERVAWYPDAFVLAPGVQARDVWALPLYEQGGLYLQSLYSMLPALALGPEAGLDVLDMCAAPGGKTTQMAALTAGRAHITACEMHMPRSCVSTSSARVRRASTSCRSTRAGSTTSSVSTRSCSTPPARVRARSTRRTPSLPNASPPSS